MGLLGIAVGAPVEVSVPCPHGRTHTERLDLAGDAYSGEGSGQRALHEAVL